MNSRRLGCVGAYLLLFAFVALSAPPILVAQQGLSGPGLCEDSKTSLAPSGTDWNGWGADLANTRFQPGERARLTVDQVPRLKLKWAFVFPRVRLVWGQPTVVGGRVFAASVNRFVYSLDASTGCQYWAFEAEAAVRTAIFVAQLPGPSGTYAAFFGDQFGNAYSVDTSSGKLLWKVRIDPHPHARITGALAYYDGRVFVPLTGGEESSWKDNYECCTSRGGLVALDAVTGKQVWKTYAISEEPHPTTRSASGVQFWGPSGASIWSAPTIDTKRRIIYAGTGNNFSQPDTRTSDAILAFNLDSGKLLWAAQLTAHDIFDPKCFLDDCGTQLDVGSSPILITLNGGRRELLVGQKSGVAWGLDPDHGGKVLWQTRIGHGGKLGGIQWGSAYDGHHMYAALSDLRHTNGWADDPNVGGGLFALDVKTGARVWEAPPFACNDRPMCSPAQSAAIAVIPGVVFSGGVDGRVRAYSTTDGKVIWEFDTVQDFSGVNGLLGRGGAIDGGGLTVAGGMLFVGSGYWSGLPGNVLLAFSVDGDSSNVPDSAAKKPHGRK